MADAATPFRTWNGVEAWQFVDGVRLHAIGGEQILLCRVTYEPGKQVPDHDHRQTEQVMAIVEGEVTVTVGGETRDVKAGDVITAIGSKRVGTPAEFSREMRAAGSRPVLRIIRDKQEREITIE